jgi:predicted TIM-barrel fold metal-dependent hydrolase
MQTPWGDITVADAHVHFFSRRFFETLGAQGGRTAQQVAAATAWDLPPEDPAELAQAWAAALEAYGITQAALISSVPGDEASVASAVAARPDRFFGYFMLNPMEEDALDRARAAFRAGLHGVSLFPAMHRYCVHDAKVLAVLDEAARHPGRVVFVHCGVLTVGVRKKLGLPSPFDMRYSNPIDLHGVALRYPGLNFVIPHFGAGYFREALMLADLCANVYLDTSSSNSWMKYEGLDLKTVYRRAIEVVGSGRLLFGTDSSFFPRGWNEQVFQAQTRALLDMDISESDVRLILGENLQRLLNRDLHRVAG